MEPGFTELLILALIGVIFLGPRELARIAYKLGSWTRSVRRMSQEFMYELTREADLEEARDEARKIEEMMRAPAENPDASLENYHPPEPTAAISDAAATPAPDEKTD